LTLNAHFLTNLQNPSWIRWFREQSFFFRRPWHGARGASMMTGPLVRVLMIPRLKSARN